MARRGIQGRAPPRNALLQNRRRTRAVRLSLDGARPVRHSPGMHDSAVSVKLISAGALASALGLTPDGVKVAETEGRLPPAERTPGGHRRWDPAKVAAHYQAKGVPVPERLAALVPAALERRT